MNPLTIEGHAIEDHGTFVLLGTIPASPVDVARLADWLRAWQREHAQAGICRRCGNAFDPGPPPPGKGGRPGFCREACRIAAFKEQKAASKARQRKERRA